MSSLEGLDYTSVEAFKPQILLTFINQFLMTSVETLTSFATTCDTKLENCCVRIQKMEAALVLVEKKLSSGKEDSSDKVAPKEELKTTSIPSNETTPVLARSDATHHMAHTEVAEQITVEASQASNSSTNLKLSDHPQIGNYFKMLRLGVPAQAVKLKMSREGFEPRFLDLPPDSPLPKELEFSVLARANNSDSSEEENPDFD